MFYEFVGGLMKCMLHPIFRIKIIGAENIPEEGGVVLAVNHRSNWDPVMSALACPRPVYFMAKKELFKNRLFGALITKLKAFPVSRNSADLGAIKKAMSLLKDGNVVLLFPEGKRVREGESVDAKDGVSMIALKSKVPVVPAVISGKYKLFSKIHIRFDKPVSLEEYYGQKVGGEQLHEISTGIMNRIKAMDSEFKNK